MSTIDKVIITNRAAMAGKYQASGTAAIETALRRLITADAARGLTTIVVALDDAAQMTGYGGRAVVNAFDQKGAKDAVDAIYAKLHPDYLMLLDGPDVVPHVALNRITGLTDADGTIDSDLPYASPATFSRQASSFLAVTRVVGRLPMAVGSGDSAAFTKLIERCADYVPPNAAAFSPYFAVSAAVWKQSTQLSLQAIFGDHGGLQVSPAAGHTGIDPALRSLAHFINCHGAPADWRFYGQQDRSYPVAMDSSLVAPHVAPGTVVAAECCYGAQLYDQTLALTPPMCVNYMLGGALAFMGSTTIAYGPATSNGQADLLTQYFFQNVIKGGSIGSAMLQARQTFISTQLMSSPANLKTLAQFVLYGDPSLVAVAGAKGTAVDTPPPLASLHDQDIDSDRKARRIMSNSFGRALASSATFPGRKVQAASDRTDRVRALAKLRGYTADPVMMTVTGGTQYRQAAKASRDSRHIAIFTEQGPDHHDTESGLKSSSYRVLIAHMFGDGITAVEECESR